MEKLYQFREELLEVHKPHRVNDAVWRAVDGVVVTDGWRIVCNNGAGVVLANAAADLAEYFAISMDRKVPLESSAKNACRTGGTCVIRIGVDAGLRELCWRLQVTDGCIEITGSDERTAAQGCYALEDEMNLNEGPVIARGDITRRLRYSPRIIHSGMDFGMYPHDHLRAIAHASFDAIILDTREAVESPEVAARINAIIDDAASLGIAVYTFAAFKNERHPDDPDAREHYETTYGRLFTVCPGLRGIFFVGESCEFPSRDTHVVGSCWRDVIDEDKPSPGWYPCEDYPAFISLLRDVIHSHKPDADLVFWTYNWGYADPAIRVPLIRAMPKDVTVMATFEMFEEFEPVPGAREVCTDYTLWFTGPGVYFETESRAAAEAGLRMYSMTNTGGNTWDIGGVPYLPAPYQWMERFKAINNAQDKMALHGLLESHTYGFWPSMMPTLAKYAFCDPAPSLTELLNRIVARDFGAKNLVPVLDALSLYSKGMTHCVPTNEDQYGPARIGPSYPLFFKTWEPLPIGPESARNPNETCCPVYRFNPDFAARLDYELDEYRQMARLFSEGNRLLEPVVAALPDKKRRDAEKFLGVAKFIENTAKTVANVKEWHRLKIELGVYVDHRAIWTGGRKGMADASSPAYPVVHSGERGVEEIVHDLLAVAEAEVANAAATIPLVEADSRLGYTQELDYCTSVDQLRWKMKVTGRAVDEIRRFATGDRGQVISDLH